MRLLSNLHMKGKSAVLPHRAIRSQSHCFIYRPCIASCADWLDYSLRQLLDWSSDCLSPCCQWRND